MPAPGRSAKGHPVTAVVTGPFVWILFAAFAGLCLWALVTYRAICRQDDARRARRRPRAKPPGLWLFDDDLKPWPTRLHQQNAPALVETARGTTDRR